MGKGMVWDAAEAVSCDLKWQILLQQLQTAECGHAALRATHPCPQSDISGSGSHWSVHPCQQREVPISGCRCQHLLCRCVALLLLLLVVGRWGHLLGRTGSKSHILNPIYIIFILYTNIYNISVELSLESGVSFSTSTRHGARPPPTLPRSAVLGCAEPQQQLQHCTHSAQGSDHSHAHGQRCSWQCALEA